MLAARFFEIGFSILATKGTADYFEGYGLPVTRVAKISETEDETVVDLIRKGVTQVVINTMDKNRQKPLKTDLLFAGKQSSMGCRSSPR